MTLLCGWGDLSQRLMDIADHHRPFADRRGDALHRSLAHIADGVDARPARFEPAGHTIERPARLDQFERGDVGAGLHEAALVAHHFLGQPARIRTRAEEEEQEAAIAMPLGRSEEHTSELQSLMRISYAVFCLKKKNKPKQKLSKVYN